MTIMDVIDAAVIDAATKGHTAALKVLIEAGANIEAKNNWVRNCCCVWCVGQGG